MDWLEPREPELYPPILMEAACREGASELCGFLKPRSIGMCCPGMQFSMMLGFNPKRGLDDQTGQPCMSVQLRCIVYDVAALKQLWCADQHPRAYLLRTAGMLAK